MDWKFVQVLAWVYGLGFVAAAPVGPVNLVAIRRGILGKWPHTLACGIGAAIVDLSYYCVAALGGGAIVTYFRDNVVRDVMGLIGASVLIPLGTVLLLRVFHANSQRLDGTRRKIRQPPPAHLWTDVGTGIVLTAINPAAPVYWLAGAAPWLVQAKSVIPNGFFWWGLITAAAGFMTWFGFIAFLVRFAPRQIGPRFFRAVNGLSGGLILIFGLVCLGMVIARHI